MIWGSLHTSRRTHVSFPIGETGGKLNFLAGFGREVRMKRSRFTDSQIVEILKEADAGLPANDVWRRHGISSATYYIYGRLPRGKKDWVF